MGVHRWYVRGKWVSTECELVGEWVNTKVELAGQCVSTECELGELVRA